MLIQFQTKNQKKSRLSANHVAEEVFGAVPHSFVFHRGQVGKNVGQLVEDMRRVMEPYTAESLKVRLFMSWNSKLVFITDLNQSDVTACHICYLLYLLILIKVS